MIQIAGEVVVGVGLIGVIATLMFQNNKAIDDKITRNNEVMEEKFTNKEVCNVLHKRIDADLQEIKDKVSALPEIKVTLHVIKEFMRIPDGK